MRANVLPIGLSSSFYMTVYLHCTVLPKLGTYSRTAVVSSSVCDVYYDREKCTRRVKTVSQLPQHPGRLAFHPLERRSYEITKAPSLASASPV